MTKYNKQILKYLDKIDDIKLKIYARKLGINKSKLYSRKKIYRKIYKKYNLSAFKIQSFFKKNIKNIETKSYYNNETLLGDKIIDIDSKLLYVIDNYIFNIKELKKNLEVTNKNPYTQKIISKYHINTINKKINDLENNNISLNIDNDMPINSLITSKISSLFYELSILNSYPNINIFTSYSNNELYSFMKQIYRYNVIKNVFTENDYNKITNLYNKIKYDKNIEIKFKCKSINLLEKIIKYNDSNNYLRGIIINENIVDNINSLLNVNIYDYNYDYNHWFDELINNSFLNETIYQPLPHGINTFV